MNVDFFYENHTVSECCECSVCSECTFLQKKIILSPVSECPECSVHIDY